MMENSQRPTLEAQCQIIEFHLESLRMKVLPLDKVKTSQVTSLISINFLKNGNMTWKSKTNTHSWLLDSKGRLPG